MVGGRTPFAPEANLGYALGMRRFLTLLTVAASTAVGTLWWLHDGDLSEAVEPVLAEWDADLLARDAGLTPAAAPADAPVAEPKETD